MFDDLITLDTNGDGIDDALGFWDENGYNCWYDNNGDGMIDTTLTLSDFDAYGNPLHCEIQLDTDSNGVMDTAYSEFYDAYGNLVSLIQSYDYDQDGRYDMMKEFFDTTGDGQFDTVVDTHYDNTDSETLVTIDTHIDVDGDQHPDAGYHMEIADNDHDGIPDNVHLATTDSNGDIIEETDMPYSDYMAMNGMNFTTNAIGAGVVDNGQFDVNTDPSLVSGDPASDMEHWEYQGNTGRCAIYAQKFAIEALTGRDIPIEELVAVAEEHGWFNEAAGGGTTSLNMSKLLEYYGVENEMSFDNDISELENALNNNHKVIVSVDSDQIWYGAENNIFSPETASDHAVEVIGIDHSDPENPMVVLNDSGSPDGCGELVPLDVFENAWNAGDSQMIVCYSA